jgi:quercetin dioxygenase-like cupin family protein
MAVEEHELKLRVSEVPIDQSLDPDQGWGDKKGDMNVQWIITKDTVGATDHVIGLTVFPPGTAHHVHRHPNAEEAEYLLKGTGLATIGDTEVRQNAGEIVFVPKNEWHGFRNDSDEEAVLLWTYGGAGSLDAAGYVQRERNEDA